MLTCRGLAPKYTEPVAHQEDNIELCVSRNIAELFVSNSAGNDGDAIITQLLVNLHDRYPRVRRQRSGKETVPAYPASNIQDARFLSATNTLPDKGLLFGAKVKEITATTIHSGTTDYPHAEFHVAVWLP